jgi:adenine-specific DNA glycosylase
VTAVAGALRRRGHLLLLRRSSRGLLGGLWELPSGDSLDALLAGLVERTGLRASAGAELGRIRHVFTHRVLDLRVVALERRSGRLARGRADHARWCSRAQLESLPLSRLMHRVLELLSSAPRVRSRRRPGSRGSILARP